MPKTRPSDRKQEIKINRLIKKVLDWQTAGHVHPLTCRVRSSHPILRPELRGGKVVLVCPECLYVQEHIPETVLKGVPPMPLIAPERSVTVIISKKDWRALLENGNSVGLIQVFSEGELHHKFGDKPEEYIVRVKITPITS